MDVLFLTVFLSLCLAAWFTLAFVRNAIKSHAGAWERESLLPLAPEVPAGNQAKWMTPIADEHHKNIN